MAIFNELDLEFFFPEKSRAYIDAVIARLMRRELAAGRQTGSGRASWRSSGGLRRYVKAQLASALSRRGTALSSTVSVRRLSEDGGGRSFHFDHSSVSCSRSSPPSPKAKPACKAASRSSESAGRGSAAAHMRYIERHGAVETGTPAPAITDERGQAVDEHQAGTSAAAAGQGYLENATKVAHPSFSFGTIGSTQTERMAFWDLLERHERNENCRVQERLIVELPHEASAEARLEMVRAFCSTFERLGLPYWAALHAPGPNNDRRNFHAHVVYSTRPARRMVDPGDGAMRWDFAITEAYQTSSRNRKIKHPYRQKRCPEMTRKGAVRALRDHFAEVVNVVLAREDVRDAAGRPVRYDPRSNRAMGLGAPIETVRRGEAERARDGHIAVPDGGHTRAGFEAIDAAAEARRGQALADVSELATACTSLATSLAARRARAGTARQDGDHGDRGLWAAMPGAVAPRLIRARSDMHAGDAEEPLARATFARLAEATSPAAVARAEPKPTPGASPTPPLDADVLQRLHEEAEAEAEDFEAESRVSRRRRRGANDVLSVLWMGTVTGADAPPDRPSTPAASVSVAPEREAPPQPDNFDPAAPAFSSMPEGALERVRERLPGTLAVMDCVMGAIRALPAGERSRLMSMLTDTENLAAFVRTVLETSDRDRAQPPERAGAQAVATTLSSGTESTPATPNGSAAADPSTGQSADIRPGVSVDATSRSAQRISAAEPVRPEQPHVVTSAHSEEPKRPKPPTLDQAAASAEPVHAADQEASPDGLTARKPDKEAARKAARRKAILAKRSKGNGGRGR